MAETKARGEQMSRRSDGIETAGARGAGARAPMLVLAAIAAIGWVAAFYALWIDAGNREAAAAAIARLEAENAMLRQALAPLEDLADAPPAPPAPPVRAPEAHASLEPAETGGVIRLADAGAVALAQAERTGLEAEIARLGQDRDVAAARLAELDAEAQAFAECAATGDFAGAVAAFLERRAPHFNGR